MAGSVLVIGITIPGQALAAQGPVGVEPNGHASAPVVSAVRLTAPIHVDGVLDEAVWTSAVAATRFVQNEPDEGAAITEPIDVRIAYDDDAIYVGALLYDSEPVTTRLARRDGDIPDSDWFSVSFDSYHDHLTAYRFSVNPSGVRRDEIMTGVSQFDRGDSNWDPVWHAMTAITDSGWTVEMRIPFSQLRFSQQRLQTWGIQVERRIGRTREGAVFSFTPRNERGGVARYGHLVGLEDINANTGRLEVLPYVLAKADYRLAGQSSSVSFANPFRDGSLHTAGAGADLLFRPSSNVTVSGTVNPDFGQVELDPAVINLTAFETRFDEKRPFFVEGAELFRFGGESGRGGMTGGGFGGGGGGGGGASSSQLVYSRRIGRTPQAGVPSAAVYSDVPEATTIAGAAKITARTATGWSVGIIDAVTAAENATWVDASGAEQVSAVEPLTNYLAGRIRKDMRAGQTVIGGLATAVNRDLSGGLQTALRSSAYSGGFDLVHEWADREWSVTGFLSGSRIAGDPAVVTRAQRTSARYFQRPDATHLDVDSAATTLVGYAGKVDLGKRSGTWRGNAALTFTSPGYEVNDLGFQTAADRFGIDLNFSYYENTPGRTFRRYDLRVGPELTWNFGGDLVRSSLGAGGGGQLSNFWSYRFNLDHQFETYDDRLTRGGVLARSPAQNSGFLFLNSDTRARLVGRLTLSASQASGGAWRWSTDLEVSARPAANLDIKISPNLTRSRSPAQYVSTINDPTASTTLGRRYIFSTIEQTTLALETRVNVTFSPVLSLELYAQPFASSGDYKDIKQLRRPGTYDFDVFGVDAGTVVRDSDSYLVDPDGPGPATPFRIDDADFNVHSFRGNAVLRWEWRPGSTLFLVWQQNRSGRWTWDQATPADPGSFSLERDVREIFDLRPDNVFIFKLSYWINP